MTFYMDFPGKLAELKKLGGSKRRKALESLVTGELRAVSPRPEDEDPPPTANLLELGYTPALLDQVRRRLERAIGRPIRILPSQSATVSSLIAQLTYEVLPDLFPPQHGRTTRRSMLWDEVMRRAQHGSS
jgi:hypothetical protein